MPKIGCRCGHVFNLVETPHPDCYKLVSEVFLDSLYGSPATADDIVGRVHLEPDTAYLCPACGRVIVIWKKPDGRPTFYAPEPDT